MGNTYFNAGCALNLYKPEMEQKILDCLIKSYDDVKLHQICCQHEPKVEPGTVIINTCPGCDRRFGSLYEGVSTISLWEAIDKMDGFHFPDYNGMKMTVHDACPVRGRSAVHDAIRSLLSKMNIEIVEAENHRENSVCCGDSFYPAKPVDVVKEKMINRAESMPCENVAVYCVSCIKAMAIGNKTPKYIVDLLFNESTVPGDLDTEQWHKQVRAYIDAH